MLHKYEFLNDYLDERERRIVEESGLSGLASDPYPLVYKLGMDFTKVHAYGLTVMDEEGFPVIGTPSAVAAAVIYAINLINSAKEELDIESFLYGNAFDDDLARNLLTDQGSTCLTLSKAKAYAERILDLRAGSLSDACIRKAVRILYTSPFVKLQHAGDKVFIFSDSNMLNEEKEISVMIKERLQRPSMIRANEAEMYAAIEASEAEMEKLLSQEQTQACKMVLSNRLSVITGGPGTGKTQTQLVLISAFRKLYPNCNIVCIAPTAQAAKRMSEVTGEKARTLHSFMKLAPGEMYLPEFPSLAEGSLVIADESSMIDTEMCLSLLRALSPDCHLLLSGDVAQLPSVGKGCVLKEIIESGEVPVSRLTKIFRQKDNSIAFNSAKIHAGNPNLEYDKRFVFIEAHGSEDIAEKVTELYKRESKKEGSLICLTPLRVNTETGVYKLNDHLRTVMKNDDAPFVETSEGIRIYEGDKVVFLKNTKGLINGEIGTAEKCDSALTCSFGNTVVTLEKSEFDLVIPAYAQTVHKSQGQEFDTGIIILDPAHKKMASKEIVYTAVTRIKSHLYIVGDPKTLEETITGGDMARTSALGSLLNVICA